MKRRTSHGREVAPTPAPHEDSGALTPFPLRRLRWPQAVRCAAFARTRTWIPKRIRGRIRTLAIRKPIEVVNSRRLI